MRSRSILKWVLTGAAVMLVAGSAVAQQPSGTSTPTGSTPGASSSGAGAAGTVPLEQTVTLSPDEQMSTVDGWTTTMSQQRDVVARQLAEAREQRDPMKILCLNDKLSQIDVAIRGVRDHQSDLNASAKRASANHAQNDIDAASHAFTMCQVLKQRHDGLVADANTCLGQELTFVGATQVIAQTDPTLPGDDVTDYTTDTTLGNAAPVPLTQSK